MSQTLGAGILQFKSSVFASADTLRGAGVKTSEWPTHMMPFFALALVESRLLRLRDSKLEEFQTDYDRPWDALIEDDREWMKTSIECEHYGYHDDLVMEGMCLKIACSSEGGNVLQRLLDYVGGYDEETRKLLGVGYGKGGIRFMDFEGIASYLSSLPNQPLYAFAKKWADIDFKQLNNSEITNLEELIKREWGDMSAETAGEQFTPFDMIQLAGHLAETMLARQGEPSILNIYDMTCGGGNFLFAMEDHLKEVFPTTSIVSYGQELNPQLYALSAIEARFRNSATIKYGNTLTDDQLSDKSFELIFANPPYGGDWKDVQTQVRADASGRFSSKRMPSVSDSQMLFLQHAHHHLTPDGIGFIVHSGSSLFSGDAGSGESETRRYLFQETDSVEAIVQMPKGEFFNTGINTYMWILNKNKPADRKSKVLLINAETLCTKLKKNLNQKNVEIDEDSRAVIAQALAAFVDGPYTRVVSTDDVLYNNVTIQLAHADESGLAIQSALPLDTTFVLSADSVVVANVVDSIVAIKDVDVDANGVERIQRCIEQATVLSIAQDNDTYSYNVSDQTVALNGVALGGGKLDIKVKLTKYKKEVVIKIVAALQPVLTKDVEVAPHSSVDNQQAIDDFLKRWVTQPYTIEGFKVGCEINFNKFFPKASTVKPVADVLQELVALNAKLALLDATLLELGVH